MSRDTLQRTLVQSGFLFAGWFSLGLEVPFLRYGFGTLFFAISWAYSLRFLLHSTGFFCPILRAFFARIHNIPSSTTKLSIIAQDRQ